MRERIEPALRIACVALGALLVFQIVGLVPRVGLLRGIKIPALPTLTAVAEGQSGDKGTNTTSGATTNRPGTETAGKDRKAGPNTVSGTTTNGQGSKTSVARQHQERKGTTNAVAVEESVSSGTNAPANPPASKTTTGKEPKAGTNSVALRPGTESPGLLPTNAIASSSSNAAFSTNKALSSLSATNVPGAAKSNLITGADSSGPRPGSGRSSRPTPLKLTDLPPALLARVDRVVDSELLGPVIRPMPAALLGIAGDVAFLRAPNGQSSMVKEGDNVGNMKLLRIGINRVLVEEDGQKKELMIFEGYGGETLLPK